MALDRLCGGGARFSNLTWAFYRKAHIVFARRYRRLSGLPGSSFRNRGGPALVSDWGKEQKTEFVTGYILELSLSMVNVFVMAIIFSYFRIPNEYQHRVLFWGVLGALIMRGLMIGLGTALIQHVSGMMYIFGAFLVFTGMKMLFSEEEGVHPKPTRGARGAKLFRQITTAEICTFIDGRRVRTVDGGLGDGRDDGPGVCAGFHSGDIRRHAESIYCILQMCLRSLGCARCTSCWPGRLIIFVT